MNEKEKDFYQKLRNDIKNWLDKNLGADKRMIEFLLLAPDIFHLMVKLTIDPDVPAAKKVKLAAAIAYFISPIDLIPEILVGPIGYIDDVSIAAYVLNDLMNNIDPQIIKRNWAGERDILDAVKTILVNANNMLGSGLWGKLKKKFQ